MSRPCFYEFRRFAESSVCIFHRKQPYTFVSAARSRKNFSSHNTPRFKGAACFDKQLILTAINADDDNNDKQDLLCVGTAYLEVVAELLYLQVHQYAVSANEFHCIYPHTSTLEPKIDWKWLCQPPVDKLCQPCNWGVHERWEENDSLVLNSARGSVGNRKFVPTPLRYTWRQGGCRKPDETDLIPYPGALLFHGT